VSLTSSELAAGRFAGALFSWVVAPGNIPKSQTVPMIQTSHAFKVRS